MKKFALVTGASRGIGRAICVQLAKDFDYHILINFQKNEDAAKETLKLVEANGGKGSLLQFNVANAEETSASLSSFFEHNPDAVIEVLVNNAGIKKDNLFIWMQPEDWQQVIDTSLKGFYNVTQPLIQKLVLNKFGRIINIASISGLKGTAGQVNYAAAKGALVAATKALAQEVAKKNVTVNAVAPGFIQTDMTTNLNEKELKKQIPINRFGTAEEVAHLVSFLASKKASYITGEVININGGLYS